MSHRIDRSTVLLPALTAAAAVLLGLVVTSAADAAGSPTTTPKLPTPVSATTCWASLTPAPTALEPNLLSYQFHCDTPITAYTLLANRRPWDSGVIDDFATSPLTTLGDGVTPDPKTSWTCEGSIPADGFNCTAGLNSKSTALSSMAAWSIAQGTLDTTDPYCGTPAASGTKKKPAKRANPLKPIYRAGLPPAFVQLVVTDSTGAQDGPFVLWDTARCQLKKPHKHHHHAPSGK